MTRRRAWLGNGFLLVVAIVLAAALAEVGIRWVAPQPLGVWHHDRDGLALHWPGRITYLPQFGQTVSFNSEGMRDREHAVPKPVDVFRILVLGDSFMEALQVPFEASFPSLLERALDGQARKRVEVVNASVSGWGTDDELQYLTTYGMKWRPDLVVVVMTLHNDLSDNLRQRFHTTRNSTLVERPRDKTTFLDYKLVQLKGFLATRSHAYQLVIRSRRTREMRGEARQLSSHVVEILREEPGEAIVKSVDLTGLLLERIKTTVAAEGGRVVLVLLPLAMQLSDATFADLARAAGQELRIDGPQRLVTRVAARAGIPVIDLLPGLRAWTAGGGAPLYLERDGHWNERGHRLAAEIVSRELVGRGLVL